MDSASPLPPNDLFDSREAAQQSLQQWAKGQSFAVVFNRTKKNKQGEYCKQWVHCSKYGTFKTEGHGIRETTSREDCKWQAQLL